MSDRKPLLLRGDPRHAQIAVLSALWLGSVSWLDFAPSIQHSFLAWCTCLASEWLCQRWRRPRQAPGDGRLSRFDARSPLITGLSLSLLLRVADPLDMVAAGVLAIASKQLRVGGRHLFNPANAGIVAAVLLGSGWISPGQWGSWLVFAAALACCGLLVCMKASRLDLALAFLGGYAAALLARAWWLGDPLAIPFRELQSGTLVLFVFFMITDPRTTPTRRDLRLVLAALLLCAALALRFWWFLPNAFVYSLFVCAPVMRLVEELLSRLSAHREERVPPGECRAIASRQFGSRLFRARGAVPRMDESVLAVRTRQSNGTHGRLAASIESQRSTS